MHAESFSALTGPKIDLWLAQAVGVLLVVCGATLLLAGRAGRVTREIVFLGATQATALTTIDLWCVFEPRTTRAYWLDAAVEFALVVAWIVLSLRRRSPAAREVGDNGTG